MINWSQPRKSYKPSENVRQFNLTTPSKKKQQPSQHTCTYHFNELTHVCLNCQKSICLRCVLTYCKQHMIYQQNQIIPNLKQQLTQLQIKPLKEQITLKIKQSSQRKQYIIKKFQKINKKVDENFDYVINIILKKKQLIQNYYQQQSKKILQDYQLYDRFLLEKMDYLRQIEFQPFNTIEQLKIIEEELSQCLTGKQPKLNLIQSKINKTIIGKDKIQIDKIWSEEKLQRILYEIENINYKMITKINAQSTANLKKKRISTEAGWGGINNTINVIKSTSHSKIHSGRRIPDQQLPERGEKN